MNRKQLQEFIYTNIPLSKAMGLQVLSCSVSRGVRFQLPLKPNRNHKNTAFGGTLVAVQAIACWAWLLLLLKSHKMNFEIVIQRQNAEFLKPVAGDFCVSVLPAGKEEVAQFLKTLKAHKKARLSLYAQVVDAMAVKNSKRAIACSFYGEYVAQSPSTPKKG